MSRRKQLQNRQGAILEEQKAISAKLAEEERTDLNEEEQQLDAALDAEFMTVSKALEFENKLLEREKGMQAAMEMRLSPEVESVKKEALAYPRGIQHRTPAGFDNAEHAYRCGQWLQAAVFKNESAAQWWNEHAAPESFAMVGANDAAGGALVPDELARTIINLQENYGVFRANARIWPMASDSLIVPRRTGGLTTYWVGEETAITASDASFDQVALVARKLGTLTRISTELAEDAIIDIAAFIVEEIARAFASKEDDCGFLGTGASTYGGIEGLITALAAATASIVTALTGNTAFATLDLVDFEAMIGKLPEYPGIEPKWYISKAGWAASMMRLQDAAGGNTTADIAGGVGLGFLGFPVVLSQKMNSTLAAQTSTNGLCYFGDLSMAATMGVRRGITIKTTEERYIEYDQIGLVATERFDINVHDVGDTSNAGAMIMLATPSS